MALFVVMSALVLLMFIAYRGFSVILFAPLIAMLAVLVTDPAMVAPMFSSVFMEKMVGFLKLYFPVFLLGAIFGKVIELSGFSKAIASGIIHCIGSERAILAIVLVCAVLTYGGVSLFVVVFAVYPFATEMFKQGSIPKRLIPGTIALGAFSFTMDALPGTPQIQNIIPTNFFDTTTWAAPWSGVLGSVFILVAGMTYLEGRRKAAFKKGEGYGQHHTNEPEPFFQEKSINPLIALMPLVLVGVLNKIFTQWIPQLYGTTYSLQLSASAKTVTTDIAKVAAIWAVEAALLVGILSVLLLAFKPIYQHFVEGSKAAIGGALLAATNTATEYGFGAVIAALPGFLVIADALKSIPNPLVNEAITVTAMAGITGTASGGLSIALAAMSDMFIEAAQSAHIPLEVMHRIASMASGGMDTLPHNGAVITLLAVTGLTHRVSYGDIFAVTCIKTLAVFFVIAVYYLTGIY